MDIQFYGANRYVTGSCTLVTGNGKKILIDCGLPQGNDAKIGGFNYPSTRKISIISFSPMRTSIIAGGFRC